MKTLILLMLGIVLVGCATQTFNIQPSKGYASKEETHHFFFEGIAQSKNMDAAYICGGVDKVAKVEVEQSLIDGVLALLTYHIYSPREARVYCTK